MNVLFFSRLFYPHIGGVEKHVLEISKILIQKGYRVTVVTEQHSSDLKLKENVGGIDVFRIANLTEGKFKKFKVWKWLWSNKELIKSADVVHCHDVFFWYLPFRFLFPNKPVYTTFHGYEGNNLPSQRAIFMHKLAEKLSLGNICVGNYLKKWYGTKPNYAIYGAVDVQKKEYKKRFNEKHIKITYLGRLEAEAGIMVYLRALKTLKSKGYTISLIVLGDGIQRIKAERFCRINNLKVDFKGFVKDVYHYLFNSDFVFTSRFLSTMEALNARKFTFVVQTSAINNDSFKLSPFSDFISLNSDEVSLADNFIYYLENKNLMQNKIQNGYIWVKQQAWKNVVQSYLLLWKIF